jgi:aminopeptidase
LPDPRDRAYAELLVEGCLDIQPGWQVLVAGTPLGRPLLDEICAAVARRGAYALLRLTWDGWAYPSSWMAEAPEELLAKPASIREHELRTCDALIAVDAPENTRERAGLPQERLLAVMAAYRPATERILAHEVPWVGGQYPTPALAQDAGMSTSDFADFLYGACLRDWEAERERMTRYAERFAAASEVRIVGDGTDLVLGIEGREPTVDALGANMPGGEFFMCPVEDSAQGTIAFSEFPAVYFGREIAGIRLRFEGGRVVDASADQNEETLLETLDTDEGARGLGELGVGCNPGITRYMKNTLFDEKMDGTVHLALGNGFPDMGGKNISRIHWDIVKDLRRPGTRLELDGEVVQRDGAWAV